MKPLVDLLTFLSDTMSMTDVYQPAVILHLLERGGTAGKHDLARTLAGYTDVRQKGCITMNGKLLALVASSVLLLTAGNARAEAPKQAKKLTLAEKKFQESLFQ